MYEALNENEARLVDKDLLHYNKKTNASVSIGFHFFKIMILYIDACEPNRLQASDIVNNSPGAFSRPAFFLHAFDYKLHS